MLLTAGLSFTALTAKADNKESVSLLTNAVAGGVFAIPGDKRSKIEAPDACYQPPSGLVSWYTGEPNVGNPSIVQDIWGPNNGVWEGVPTYGAGEVGQAFLLTGTNDVRVSNATGGVNLGAAATGGISNDEWINTSIATQEPIIEWNSNAATPGAATGVHFWVNFPAAGKLYLNLIDTAGVSHAVETQNAVVTMGTYQFVGFTYDKVSGNVSIYYNGVAQPLVVSAAGGASGAAGSTTLNVGNITPQTGVGYDLYIGKRNATTTPATPATNFVGNIDEVELFNRAIAAGDFAGIFQSGGAGKCHTSVITLTSNPTSVAENSGSYTITATRTGANDVAQTVNVITTDGGTPPANPAATGGVTCGPAGVDYESINPAATLTFPVGSNTASITNPICDDSIFEGDENFTATLVPNTATNGAQIGAPDHQVFTITDNDAAPSFTVNSPAAVVEGQPVVFTITENGNAAQGNQVVCYNTVDGSAVAPGDYTPLATNGTNCVTFTPGGPTTQTVTVQTVNDSVVEPTENFFLNINNITGGGSGVGQQGTGTILDNDSSFSIVANPTNGAEGTATNTTAHFVVTRSTGGGASNTVAHVDFLTINGTAVGGPACTAGVDYITQGGTLTFNPGDTTMNVDVTVCGDSVFENNENFSVALSNPVDMTGTGTAILVAPSSATYTINNDDAAPTYAFTCVASVTEGNSGTTAVSYTVTRTGSSEVPSTVNFTVAGSGANPATSGTDFTVPSGSVTFPAGTNGTQTFTVNVLGDTTFEPDETYTVTLTNATTGSDTTVYNQTCQTTILNDDIPPNYTVSSVSQAEGNVGQTPFVFTVTRTGNSSTSETVTLNTQDGPAPAGATGGIACGPGNPNIDYTSLVNATVTFAPGDTSKTIPVIVCGDTLFETNETFFVNITGTSAGGTFNNSQGTGTIVNDDQPPTITVGAASVTEGNAGTTVLSFPVTSTDNSGLSTVVSYHTTNGTATGGAACGAGTAAGGVDYLSQNAGVVTFGPGETNKTIDVIVCGDTVYETNETVNIVVDNATNAVTPVAGNTGTINNDDAAPTFSISGNQSITEGNSGSTPVTMTVTRTGNATEVPTTVGYTISNGTATGGNSCGGSVDYTPAPGVNYFTTSFGAGSGGTQTITTNVCGDTLFEANETYTVTLNGGFGTSGAGGLTGNTSSTVTITNDDALSAAISNVSDTEGNSGQKNFAFTITLTGTAAGSTTVTYHTVNGTATGGVTCANPGVDYVSQPPNSTIIFPAGASGQTLQVLVPVCGDLNQEPDETFQVVLDTVTAGAGSGTVNQGAIGTANSGTGTIVNDDGLPVCVSGTISQFNGANPNTNLGGVTVTLTGSGQPVGGSTTTTAANGTYQFCNLLAGGSYVVTPTLAGRTFDPTSQSFSGAQTQSSFTANFLAYGAPGAANPRTLTVVNSAANAGSSVTVPVVLQSQGNESALSFSLAYDQTRLTPTAVNQGSACGGNCTLTFNTATPGQIGINVEAGSGGGGNPSTFTAGTDQIVTVTFTTSAAPVVPQNTAVTFSDTPAVRRTSDINANPLPTTYVNGFVVFGVGFEGDVAPRTTGDGAVLSNDVTLIRQFVVGTLTPDPSTNEFQRIDDAPRATLGDGSINSTDVVQARRYAAGLDPLTPAGGPFGPQFGPIAPSADNTARADAPDAGRTFTITSVTASAGTQATVPIVLASQGDEVAYSFSINYNPAILSNPAVVLGTGSPAGCVITLNPNNQAAGQLGVLVDCPTNTPFAVGNDQALRVTFNVAANAPTGLTPVTFGAVPTAESTSNANGDLLTTTYQDGSVNVTAPTAADVTISGRVVGPTGAGVRGATVTLTDGAGNRVSVLTSSLGYYTISDVEAGRTYVLSASARSLRFRSRVLQVTDDLTVDDLVGQE